MGLGSLVKKVVKAPFKIGKEVVDFNLDFAKAAAPYAIPAAALYFGGPAIMSAFGGGAAGAAGAGSMLPGAMTMGGATGALNTTPTFFGALTQGLKNFGAGFMDNLPTMANLGQGVAQGLTQTVLGGLMPGQAPGGAQVTAAGGSPAAGATMAGTPGQGYATSLVGMLARNLDQADQRKELQRYLTIYRDDDRDRMRNTGEHDIFMFDAMSPRRSQELERNLGIQTDDYLNRLSGIGDHEVEMFDAMSPRMSEELARNLGIQTDDYLTRLSGVGDEHLRMWDEMLPRQQQAFDQRLPQLQQLDARSWDNFDRAVGGMDSLVSALMPN